MRGVGQVSWSPVLYAVIPSSTDPWTLGSDVVLPMEPEKREGTYPGGHLSFWFQTLTKAHQLLRCHQASEACSFLLRQHVGVALRSQRLCR